MGSHPYESVREPNLDQWESITTEKTRNQNCKFTFGSVLEATAPSENPIFRIEDEDLSR